MARETKPRIVSRKHLARLEKERRQRRLIILGSAIVIVIALGAILVGILDQTVLQPNRAVAEVNGEKITVNDFQTRTRYYRQNIIQTYIQYYSFAQGFGTESDYASYFIQYMQELQNQLDPLTLGQQVIDVLVDEKLIQEEADARGITVSEAEIDANLQENFGFYANGTPTPAPTDAPTQPPATLSPAQLSLVTATPTMTPTLTATPVLTPTVTPTMTQTPAPTVAATESLTPTATATPYTQELFDQNYREYLTSLKDTTKMNEPEFREIFRMQLLREKVMDAVEADLQRDQDQVWFRQIVAADKAGAQLALDRINAGEDFGAVAQELSTDSPSAVAGGDTGWQSKDELDPAVADVAYGKEIGELVGPVQTSNGWIVFQVLGYNTKHLTDTEYQDLKSTKFTEWLKTKRDASNVIIEDLWQDVVPTTPEIPAEYQLTQS